MLLSESDIQKKLEIYKKVLLKWSTTLNLVSKNTLDNIQSRHFEDSLQLRPFLLKTDKILDIGSGAGFPGMVLALCGYQVTLIDADEKKCVFLENVSRETNTPVTIICSRIESYMTKSYFDIIVSRGVASLFTLISISTPFVKEGHTKGVFLKGKNVDRELTNINLDRIKKLPSSLNSDSYIIQYQY
jgi:16S rRNA (guanine527-N7)-methyltransferase